MSNIKDSLGDRMKSYEGISRIYLTKRTPVIIRIDGKAFHSFTRGFQRPFDDVLIQTMQMTAQYLCKNIMGCKLAYTQSDEISLLLVDYAKQESQPWFENNLQKLVSVSASMATLAFNNIFKANVNMSYDIKSFYRYGSVDKKEERLIDSYCKAISAGAMFDARAFILPKEEVCNYFIWRQQDASRNSIQMVAQSLFSHSQLQNKNCDQLQEMMFQEHNVNWNDYATVYKRGSCIIKEQHNENGVVRSRWKVDTNIPIFTQGRDYIDGCVFLNEKG